MRNGFFGATGVALSLSLAGIAGGTAAVAGELEPAIVLPAGLTEPVAPAQPVITPTADLLGEPVIAPPEPHGWTWAITPRVWLLWENDFYYQRKNQDFQQSNEAVFMPFAGGSVSVTPGLGAPTFSVTALYGEGSSDVIGVQAVPTNFVIPGEGIPLDIGRGYTASVKTKRLDIEAIAQIPVAEGFSWILGGRFINFRRDEDGLFFVLSAPDISTSADFHLEQNFYLGELGFSVNRPISADGSFVAFGNLLGMVGYADVIKASDDVGVFNVPKGDLQGGVFGVDTNAGLGYRLAPNIFASARYRLFYLTAPDFKFKTGGTFMHGPELNVTFSFGG